MAWSLLLSMQKLPSFRREKTRHEQTPMFQTSDVGGGPCDAMFISILQTQMAVTGKRPRANGPVHQPAARHATLGGDYYSARDEAVKNHDERERETWGVAGHSTVAKLLEGLVCLDVYSACFII